MSPNLAKMTTSSHAWLPRLRLTNANGWRASGGAWVMIGPLACVPCPWCKERMCFWLGFGLGVCLPFGLGLCLWFGLGSSCQPSLTTCHDWVGQHICQDVLILLREFIIQCGLGTTRQRFGLRVSIITDLPDHHIMTMGVHVTLPHMHC